MFKKKYRIDFLIFTKDGQICGNGHNVIEFYPFLNKGNINDIIEDTIKNLEEQTGLKDIYKICVQNIIPYNLRDWR